MRAPVSLSISLICVLAAVGALATAGAATPTAADDRSTSLRDDALPAVEKSGQETTEATEPTTNVTVRRTDEGTVAYDLRVTDRPESGRLWVVLRGPATLVSSPGFDRVPGSGATRLVSTAPPGSEAAVTVAVSANAASAKETVAADGWTFGRVPFVEIQWAQDGSIERSWPLTERRTPDAGAAALFGDRYAVVGEYEVTRRATPNGRIDLVVPSGGMGEAQAERVADSLARASRDLDVGDRGDDALAFAAPGSARWGGESVPARDEFWVNAGSRLDDAEAVWLHEYVHTRQSFALAENMTWFREASAEYYAASLAREQGLIDRAAMDRHLDGAPSTATLTDPDSWGSDAVPQRKGGRALAVLDQRIREQTYGHRSLEAVVRRLNRHDGVVTYAVFAQTVAEVTGEPDDDWLDRHVNGSAPVTAQYGPDARPLGAALLTGLGSGETTGVGIDGEAFAPLRGAGVAFFAIATGLSVVAGIPLYGALRRLKRREGHGREREQRLERSMRSP
ncbi:hypothetical protein [Halosimplex sp. TS25]|uniref:hypothetical protein n=1 Tax=Halosimplex rarum TaxID=3396619 RepID=UPI0039ED3853